MVRQLKYWLPAVAMAVLISVFSTRYFSSEQTGRIIVPVLRWLFPFASYHTLRLMHVGIRKVAHVVEFGIFSAAVFHGVRAERYGWKWEWAVLTLLIGVAYAGLDEWHQSFVPLRESRLRDVLIDSGGALLAQILVWVYSKMHRQSPPSVEVSDFTS